MKRFVTLAIIVLLSSFLALITPAVQTTQAAEELAQAQELETAYSQSIEVACPTPPFNVADGDEAGLIFAINCANDEVNNPGADTINLAASGTYTLTAVDHVNDGNNGLPSITSEITIEANGSTIERDAASPLDFRLFRVDNSGNLTLNDATLQNGFLSGLIFIADSGGAILNDAGILTVNDSMIINNRGNRSGGGIFALAGSTTLNGVTVSGNTTPSGGDGGGVFQWGTGTLTIRDSIISGNQSVFNGGGVGVGNTNNATIDNTIITGNRANGRSGGGIYNEGTLSVTNSTISGNWENNASGTGGGGGIKNAATGNLTIFNSLLWGNLSGGTPLGHQVRNEGTLDVSFTGIESGVAGFSNTGTVTQSGGGNLTLTGGDDVFVSPVAAGSAPTSAGDYHLTTNSVALNQADNTAATNAGLTTDFEGDARIILGTVDMGADEVACGTPPFNVADGDEAGLIFAINCANDEANNPGADTINLAASGTYTLTAVDHVANGNNGLPSITSVITIEANGSTIQRDLSLSSTDSPTFRLFRVASGSNLTINDVALQNGSSNEGGAIFTDGTLTVSNSTFTGNSATEFDGGGGGVFNSGMLTVTNSAFSGNSVTGQDGGGGGVFNSGTLTVTNSTFSGNSATNSGVGGAIVTISSLTSTNSTFSGNSATSGGALYQGSGTINLAGNIFGGSSGGDNCQGSGTLNDNGYNLSDDTTCNNGGTGSKINATLNLGALTGSGPGNQVHIPGSGSDAIGLIPNGTTITNNTVSWTCNQSGFTDQLGASRPINTDDACTSGAVEVVPPPTQYTLTMAVSPGGSGTTTPAIGDHDYDEGTVVSIKASPASGYQFVNWTGSVANADNASTTVTVDADKTITANFSLIPPEGSATSSANASNNTPTVGDQIVVEINIDVTNVNPPDDALGSFTGTLDWNPAVLAYSSDSGILAGFNGAVNNSSGHIGFNGANAGGATGNSIVLTITFDVIGLGSSSLDLEYSAMAAAATFGNLLPLLTVTDDSIQSSPVQYTLTANTSGQGSVTLNPSGGTYDDATVVELTAVPAAGWQFDGWFGDISGTTNPQSITMDSNKTVTATFVEVHQLFLSIVVNN